MDGTKHSGEGVSGCKAECIPAFPIASLCLQKSVCSASLSCPRNPSVFPDSKSRSYFQIHSSLALCTGRCFFQFHSSRVLRTLEYQVWEQLPSFSLWDGVHCSPHWLGDHYVSRPWLTVILLTRPPVCWDVRSSPPCLAKQNYSYLCALLSEWTSKILVSISLHPNPSHPANLSYTVGYRNWVCWIWNHLSATELWKSHPASPKLSP